MIKIWIISLYDPTEIDQTRPMRFLSLAQKAVELDHDVTYFSNTFRHSTKTKRFEKQTIIEHSNNYKTVFIKSGAYKKNMSFGRLYSHYQYANNLLGYIKNSKEIPDIIVSALPPIHTNYKLSKWCLKNDIPYVIDIIDPWPDVFLRVIPKWLHLPFKFLTSSLFQQVKFILENASGIFSISKQYTTWAEKFIKNKEIYKAVFYPSISLDDYTSEISRYQRIDKNKLRLVYAGNLGISYDIPCILKTAQIMEDKYPGKTEFVIAGHGDFESLIKASQLTLKNIVYLGRIERKELLKLYANSDIGLAQYTKGAMQSVTYKFFDYLGSGLPILNSLQSEMTELIDRNNLGFNNMPGDYNNLSENIVSFFDLELLKEFKRNAIKFTIECGDSKIVYKNYVKALLNILEVYRQKK